MQKTYWLPTATDNVNGFTETIKIYFYNQPLIEGVILKQIF